VCCGVCLFVLCVCACVWCVWCVCVCGVCVVCVYVCGVCVCVCVCCISVTCTRVLFSMDLFVRNSLKFVCLFVCFLLVFAPTFPTGSESFQSQCFSITHNSPPQSVGLPWTSDQFITETSTWQHTTFTTDELPCPGRIRNKNLSIRATSELRLRPRLHWNRLTKDKWIKWKRFIPLRLIGAAYVMWAPWASLLYGVPSSRHSLNLFGLVQAWRTFWRAPVQIAYNLGKIISRV